MASGERSLVIDKADVYDNTTSHGNIPAEMKINCLNQTTTVSKWSEQYDRQEILDRGLLVVNTTPEAPNSPSKSYLCTAGPK